MRVAICFSGAIRSFDSCYTSINRYFLANCQEYDIFLHMWQMDSVDTKLDVNFKMRPYSYDIDKILELLKPKKYVIDKYDSNWEKKIIDTIEMTDKDFGDKKNYSYNAMGMYYKIKCANDLKCQYEWENNFKYDFVWRARLDYIFLDNLNLPTIISDNTIYLVRDRYATRSKLNTNDKFFGGNSKTMDIMCNIYYKIPEYYENKMLIEGQTLCENHIKLNGFNVEFLGDDKTYYKCQGRHDLSNINGNVFIENIDNNLSYNIAFYLLHRNYGIIYKSIDDKYNSLSILKYCISLDKSNKYNSKITLMNSNNIFINSNRIYIDDTLLNNIWVYHFIISLLQDNNIFDNYYIFNQTKAIKLSIGDSIDYLIADKGYVSGKIKEILNKGRYKIEPKIEGDIIHKSYIIPKKLCDFYIDGNLPIL